MDSSFDENGSFVLGPNDLGPAKRLRKAGSDHRKYLRQVFVSVDIIAPLCWWKEYDTCKVATVANSTSTVHKVHSKSFELTDFSVGHMMEGTLAFMETVITRPEETHLKYVANKNKGDWYGLIQLLPSNYSQIRTRTFDYETLVSIYYVRRSHKLAEWYTFCDQTETLPYTRELIIAETKEVEQLNVIIVVDSHWAIGRGGRLLVNISADQRLFRKETLSKVIVMGRETLESLSAGQPLYGRTNIALSRDVDYQAKGAIIYHSMEGALQELAEYPLKDMFIIGGQSIYEQLLPHCNTAHATHIDHEYQADIWFPNLDRDGDWAVDLENEEGTYFNLCYSFRRYVGRRYRNK